MGEVGREYDLAILGGGPAGYIAAIRAGQLGLDTILIEKEYIGGTCLNRGCIPSKMLLHVAGIISDIDYLNKVGVKAHIEKIDMKKLQKENRTAIEKLRNGIGLLLNNYGVKVVEGEGRFESSEHIHITKKDGSVESVRFRKAIIATGSTSFVPDYVRLGENIVTSRQALFIEKIPKRVVIIGGGYIAAELGTLYSTLGSEVHLLARSRLLSRIDEDIVLEAERRAGFKVHRNCIIKSVKEGKQVKVDYISESKRETVNADLVVVAIGRVPNTKNIGLENTRVTVDGKGFIETDVTMVTKDPNIYAAGDITAGPMLAHKAFMQGKVAAEAAAGIKSAAFEPNAIPEFVFTNSEIVHVGLTEKEAVDKGYEARSVKFPFSALGKAVATRNEKGFVKLVYEKNGRLLGFSAVGRGVSEILGEAGLALEMNAFLDDIAATIHAHPTLYEAIHEAAELGLGRPWHYLVKK